MLSHRAAALAACFLWAAFATAAPKPPGFDLTNEVRPTRYALDLTIFPERPTFDGEVRIAIQVETAKPVIWINARDLNIGSASLQRSGSTLTLHPIPGDEETIGLEAPAPIPPGPAELRIAFTAKLDKDSNDGAFRRLLNSEWYAFTTFTPIEARRAFPCFDQPRFKTPWELTLHVRRDQVALGNAPALAEEDEPAGMKRVRFAPTAPLASEVVAFAVGPFDVVDAGTAGRKHTPVRIIAPHGRARDAEAARTVTPAVLASLEDYTGIPYPWDKLDHIALAAGAFGAVENPGLITYQEGILLAKPERDTADRRRRMTGTIAHELAHQWFGNLVTQASWTDVWLSEGFATWLSAKVMNQSDTLRSSAIAVDEARRNWPVRRTIASRKDARQVYNRLVYVKAAAVLDTLEDWIGAEPFQRGLQRYLKDHALANATIDDLAHALDAESGGEAGAVLHSLLDHPGIPVLNASISCRHLEFDPAQWTVPVCLHWDDGGRQCTVVKPGHTQVDVPATSCPAWVWSNSTGRGYYRSVLSEPALDAVFSQGYEQMEAAERRALAADLGAMVIGGKLPARDAMKLMTVVARDREGTITPDLLRIAAGLSLIIPPGLRPEYATWMKQTFQVDLPVPQQATSVAEFLSERAKARPRSQ